MQAHPAEADLLSPRPSVVVGRMPQRAKANDVLAPARNADARSLADSAAVTPKKNSTREARYAGAKLTDFRLWSVTPAH
jgi:hypothetical protein